MRWLRDANIHRSSLIAAPTRAPIITTSADQNLCTVSPVHFAHFSLSRIWFNLSHFLQRGKAFDRLDGFQPAQLTKKLRLYAENAGVDYVEQDRPIGTAPSSTTTISNGAEPAKQKEALNDRLKRLINQSKCVLFMKGDPEAPKCGFSRQIVQMLEEASADYTTFDILTDESVRQGLKEFSNWPTFPQLYINGELVGGLDIVREELAAGNIALPKKGANLNDRLKSLVNQSPVMVFMKGTPDEPRCKFSKALMELLNETGAKFGHFDILSDDDVREGLKKYSNWPTYPQIYVRGEFVGGLDILKELKETGELAKTLSI